MSFNIDRQTFKDLNIFASESNPIFNLFKGTRTLGGRELLRTMMENPSADKDFVNSRKDCIRYFYKYKITLDIRNEELDLIEYYLKFDKRKSKANIIDSVANYITRNSSNDYYVIKTGLKYIIKLVKCVSLLITDTMCKDDLPEGLVNISQRINLIIKEGILVDAVMLNENKLNFYHITFFDRAFRGEERARLLEFLHIVYEMDVYETIAFTALEKGFCFPEYTDCHEIKVSITGLFHPQLSSPVTNDVSFSRDKNLMFLTGSNMAGKSSLLKSIALTIYLAHLGFPVPATTMQTTIFDGLVTTINLSDDINEGLSHYYSEVKRIKQVATSLLDNKKIFVIMDELFRGTNYEDAFDASQLIISELANVRNSVFLISTHIGELTEVLSSFDNISFKYLATYLEDSHPKFTYKLKDGISRERFGMYFIKNEGIIEIIRNASEKI